MDHLDRLWNGWRAEYVSSAGRPSDAGPGSVFTRILQSGASDEECNIVHRSRHSFVIVNAFPYGTGHLLVLPYHEVADLEALDDDESVDLWSTVTESVVAIKAAYRPGGVNVGINLGRSAGGSVGDHLHVHVVPRWTGDVNFMTAVANTRTLPEPLSVTATRIREAWPG